MKLTHIRIKDFRSFSGEHDFDVSSGVNYFVGPNNCGKSNLIRALELALDPDATFSADHDRPAKEDLHGKPPITRITLTFGVGRSGPEGTLLRRAREYEMAVRAARRAPTSGGVRTYADDREVRLVTTFAGGVRQSSFQAKGQGALSLPGVSELHQKLEDQFRSALRFAVIHSGEDLDSLLRGKFREILQLVISDHLGAEMAKAEAARDGYLAALQAELLEPLRSKVLTRVTGIFPEITTAYLAPNVPTVAETLSSVDVQLGDLATTKLKDKGTGVRGAVLVSMLQYLAEQSRRSLVLAVEEPEAFLHPGAQEAIRCHLEDLATRADVSLLVTTHSPYVISRSADALLTQLKKSPDGVTSKAASAKCSESHADLLGSLYRDAGLARILESSLEIPTGIKAVVVTEGYTDGLFLQQCCKAVGRQDLLEGIHFIPADGAKKVVLQAVLAEAATEVPVIAMLDYDENGKSAAEKLASFHWEPSKRILSLRCWPDACKKNHDIEIEDLLPVKSVIALIDDLGDHAALDGTEKCGDGWHYRTSKEWKERAIVALPSYLGKDDPGGMVWLAEEIHRRAEKIVSTKEKKAIYTASKS